MEGQPSERGGRRKRLTETTSRTNDCHQHSCACKNVLLGIALTPGPLVHGPRLGRLAPSLYNEWNGLCSSESTNLIGITSVFTSIRKGSRGMSSRFFTFTVIHSLSTLYPRPPTIYTTTFFKAEFVSCQLDQACSRFLCTSGHNGLLTCSSQPKTSPDWTKMNVSPPS